VPYFTEMTIRRLIKRYAGDRTLRGHQRFKYHDLVARYNTMREYWNRRLRSREEGIRIGAPAISQQQRRRPAETALQKLRQRPKVIRDPGSQEKEVRRLYLDFVRSIRQYQGDEGFLTFKRFQDLLSKQTRLIKEKKGCSAVEFRVDISPEGRVKLKAKPVRNRKG